MANIPNPVGGRAAWELIVGDAETHRWARTIVRNWGFLLVAFVLLVVWLPARGTSTGTQVLLWNAAYFAYLLVLEILSLRANRGHVQAAQLYEAHLFRLFRVHFNLAMIAILALVSPLPASSYLWFFFSMPLLATIGYSGSLSSVLLVYLEVCAAIFLLTLAQGGPLSLALATMAAKDAVLGLLAAILYFFVRLSPRVREQSTLLEAASTLMQVLDRDELSRVLADAAKAGTHHSEAAVVHLLEGQDDRTLVPRGSSHIDLSTLGRSLMNVGEGIAGHAIESRKTINVANADADERYHRLPESFTRVRSLLVAPMYVGDKDVGTISVHSSKKGAFSRRDARFLTVLAAQGAVAIANAELFGSRTRQREQIANVLEASLSFHLDQPRQALLEAIASAACECCGYGMALVGLLKGTTDRVTVAGVSGVPDDAARRLMGEGVSREELKPLLQDDFRISRSHFVRHDRRPPSVGLGPYGFSPDLGQRRPGEWHQDDRLIVTIQTQREEVLGYVFVNDPKDRQLPSLDTIQALEILASVAAIAIQNARLFEQAQEEIIERKRMEEMLAREQHLWQTFMDNVPYNTYFKDSESRFIKINRSLARWFGLDEPSQAIGMTDFDFFTQEHAQQAYDDEQVVMRTGQPQLSKEEKETWRDGHVTWVITTKMPLCDEKGRVVGTFGISRDITQRRHMRDEIRRRNQELALLNQVGQALGSTLELDELLTTLLDQLRCLMNVTATSVWLVDQETQDIVCRHATGQKCEIVRDWRLRPGEGFVGWAIRTGRSLVVPDAPLDDRHFRGVADKTGIGIRSTLLTPLRVKDDVIGVLQVMDTEAGCFEEADLDFLESLASSAAIAIANARLYEETDRLRAFNQDIVQSLEEGIIIEDEVGQITFINPKTTQLLGYSAEELIGQPCGITVAPEERDKVAEENARRRRGIASQYETVMLAKDGRRVPVLVSAKPLEEDRVFKGVLAVYTDITDAKRRETRLHEYLSSVTNNLARHTSLEGLYEFVVNAGARLLSARDCSMFLAAEAGDHERYLNLVATTGPSGGSHSLEISNTTGAQRGPIVRTAQTCRPIRLIGDDISRHPPSNEDLGREPGWDSDPRATHSLLTAPMCLPDGRLVGVLVARDTDVAGGFSELDEELLYTLATDAAAGIERVTDVDRVRDEAIRAERKRLEADLHEAINMLATGVRWEAEILSDEINRGNLDEARHALTRLQLARTRTSTDLRYILEDLRDPTLEREGLLAALKKRADLIGHGCIQVHGDAWEPLPPETEGILYRVGQEAMDNAVKHSGVMENPGIRIDVMVERTDSLARLCVCDDGVGFGVEEVLTQRHKWGLRRLRDTLHQMGGRLALDSAPGRGTTVCATVNLAKAG